MALVIGNNAYEHVPRLEKAVNDADAMAAALQGTGFTVFRAVNQTRRKMNFAMQKFVSAIEPGDVAMLFFAGLIEGFFRQLVQDLTVRYTVVALNLVLWTWYFVAAGRRRTA